MIIGDENAAVVRASWTWLKDRGARQVCRARIHSPGAERCVVGDVKAARVLFAPLARNGYLGLLAAVAIARIRQRSQDSRRQIEKLVHDKRVLRASRSNMLITLTLLFRERVDPLSALYSCKCLHKWQLLAERVGFEPDNASHINNLGPFSIARIPRIARNLSIRYKTGTVKNTWPTMPFAPRAARPVAGPSRLADASRFAAMSSGNATA
jgi:hypothetical protein